MFRVSANIIGGVLIPKEGFDCMFYVFEVRKAAFVPVLINSITGRKVIHRVCRNVIVRVFQAVRHFEN